MAPVFKQKKRHKCKKKKHLTKQKTHKTQKFATHTQKDTHIYMKPEGGSALVGTGVAGTLFFFKSPCNLIILCFKFKFSCCSLSIAL